MTEGSAPTPELVSHELRTPLTVLQGGVHLLANVDLDAPDRADVLVSMRRAINRLEAVTVIVERTVR